METYICKSCDILYKINSTNTSSDKQMNYCPICKKKLILEIV